MKILSASAAVFALSLTAFSPSSFTRSQHTNSTTKEPKIQAAILLDVSGSMSGLIEQAKAQLWNMVSVMGKAKCENGIPKIEIALYAYGQGDKGSAGDYIKQITPFSSDLDQLSQELFKLTTTGSEEYCGKVIYTSLNELTWDVSSSNYKVIFIAGNESFLQGNIQYTQACAEANKKGVIVNTIFCGDKLDGIREHWNLNSECGKGSYTNINHNATVEDIATPYDSTLFVLNDKLNGTYIGYGQEGEAHFQFQSKADKLNYSMSKSVAAKRVSVKGNANVYKNSSWDLVDATINDSTGKVILNLDKKTLPDSLKNKSVEEIKQIVKDKTAERSAIQKEILTISGQREGYIKTERAKTTANNTTTLETEVERIIREQVKRFNMYIE